jgi:hypothetical protein
VPLRTLVALVPLRTLFTSFSMYVPLRTLFTSSVPNQCGHANTVYVIRTSMSVPLRTLFTSSVPNERASENTVHVTRTSMSVPLRTLFTSSGSSLSSAVEATSRRLSMICSVVADPATTQWWFCRRARSGVVTVIEQLTLRQHLRAAHLRETMCLDLRARYVIGAVRSVIEPAYTCSACTCVSESSNLATLTAYF